MIKDSLFKKLLHECRGYKMYRKGGAVEPEYHPDYSMKKGNDYVILESENSKSRAFEFQVT